MAKSERSIVPSKISVDTYESLATDSQNIEDFSSYKRNSEASQLEKTQNLIEMLMQH